MLRVTGTAGAVGAGVQVRLLGLDDAVDTFAEADATGAFALSAPAEAGRRYLLAVGARVGTGDPLVVEFSEALAPGFAGLEVRDGAGRAVGVEITPVGSREVVSIAAEAGWQAGERYTLHLGPGLADDAGNAWGETLAVRFEVESSQVLGTYPTLATVRDLARLGSWLFVAADEKGLAVLDASDATRLRNVIPGGGDITFPFPLADPVRGVAVDPHGRVLVAGGGVQGPGQLKIFDPLALDPAAVAAAPNDPEVRFAAFRGSTRVSDQVGGEPSGTQLLAGHPRRVTVLSDDATDEWLAGEPAPDGLAVSPETPPPGGGPFTLTVSGQATEGLPVTLRNPGRGTWHRVDAGAGGAFSIALEVTAGDRLELLRNRESLGYVAILGGGLAVVDVNAVYLAADDPTPEIQVRGIFSERSTLCSLPPAEPLLLDVGGLFDPDDPHPLTVASLLAERGVLLIESQPSHVGQMTAYNGVCAEVAGSRRAFGLEVAQRYRFDFDGDGVLAADEARDYLLVAHSTAGLLVFDATDRDNVTLAGRIRVPGNLAEVALDRPGRRLFAAGTGTGIYVLDFDRPPSIELLDANGDGEDDRVLETLELAGNTNAAPFLVPELGLAFAGGSERPLTALSVGSPRLAAVAQAAEGTRRAIGDVAPFGVVTASESAAEGSPELPGAFRIQASLPGSAGPEIRLELAGLGPGGLAVAPAGDAAALAGLPAPELFGSDALLLRRQSDDPKHDGYHLYLSEEVAVVADLRAARAYARTAVEGDACDRCDPAAEGVGEAARELLAGDTVAVRFSEAARTLLAGHYTAAKLDAAELSLGSVRWETAPAIRQEPTLHPDTGMGEVAPGTLLHSGEQSLAAVDLVIRGRGFDFAFTRTYRNQGLGSGPLGPGWDHTYRQRLRELPTGDVEYHDGRGRRELFRAGGPATPHRYESPPGRFATLERTAAGWILIGPDFTRMRFDRFGRLTSIADAVRENDETGNRMTFHYDAAGQLVRIRDTLDRDITLSYDAAGRLTELSDFDGRTVTYGYDAAGRLETVTSPAIETGETVYPAGLTTTYAYESPAGDLAGRLTARDNLVSVTDARGVTWLELDYTDADGDGRREEVTSQTWGDDPLSIAYDFDNRTTTVTDRRGNPHVCRHNAAGQKTRYEDPVGATTLYGYDSEGLPTSVTEPLGRVTTWAYDTPCGGGAGSGLRRSRGNPTEIRVTADARGANGSSDALVTCVDYETRTNRPVRIVDPRGAVTTIERNAVGLPVEVREAVGAPEERTTHLAYNAFGQPTQRTNPNGHLTGYAYFATGPSAGYLRQQEVDPDGLAITTAYETDARGNVTAVTGPRGVRHTRTFNEVDWLVEQVRAAGPATDGAPALNYRTVSLHDETGNLTELRRPFGDTGETSTSERYEYGTLHEILTVRREIGDGSEAVDRYEYDPNLNPIRHIAPEGQITETVYDPRDLVESVTRGAGTAEAVEESFAYNLERQLTGRTDGRGNTWATVFDGYGRLAERRDPLGNRTTTEYDDQSNPTRVESFDGATGESLAETAFEHDLLRRRTTTTERLWRYGSPDTRDLVSETTYDPVGHATAMRDPLGRVTAYRFDAAERRVEITDPAGNRTLYELDPAGNPTATTDIEQVPAGAPVPVTTTATYDAAGRLATMTDPLGNVHRRRYDARDNLRFAIDPESFVTESRYDGLDRRIATLQPEGVDLAYTFDLASRLTEYRDALGHTTRYAHDALDRQTSVTFPDATTRAVSYDRSHNVTQIEDANGTVIAQTHDPANRLTSRQVTPAEGVAGVTAESYAWDGLDRLVRAQKGDAVTELDYDSLSRRIREATDGREVTSEHDDADNPVATAYPMAADVIGRVIDPLDRPERIGPRMPDGTVTEAASYGFRGRGLVARHAYGNGLTGTRTFDAARRPLVDSKTLAGSPVPVFEEALAWSPRSLKVAQSRGDLNGTGYALAHDGLKRLLEAARPPEPTATVPNNTAPAPSAIAALPDRFGYQYDRAQNLTARRTVDEGIGQETELPPDASGRNRPASIGGVPLAYDANGNLVQKGDLSIEYDFRNLPVRVSDSTGEIARYEYDAFNRRIARHVGGQLHETVWSGWQEIEHLVDGELVSRNLYGLGLDEIVRIDRDTDGDGVLDQQLTPLYDHTGNLAVVTDEAGRPLERYAFSPFGERTVTVDLTPPRVEQVRVTGGEVWIEASEAVRLDAVVAVLGQGSLALTDTDTGEPIPVTATQPVRTGRMQHRRVVLTPAVAPGDGTPVTLSIEPDAWVDLFSNELSAPFEESFAWPASDAVVFDNAAPELVQVAVKDGVLEVQLTEEIDPATVADGLRLDGEAVAWTTAADRYTLVAGPPVEDGSYTLELTSALADLAGTALASERSFDFTVPAADPNLFVFRVAELGEVGSSTVGNRFGFHGRPVDPETGWVFFRNRYLDPETGRFLTTDPMGYADGPSRYQFARNSPSDYSDPLGLETVIIVVGRGAEAGRLFDASALSKRREIRANHPQDTVEMYTWGDNLRGKDDFLAALTRPRRVEDRIREIHYFGHSYPGGLALGYHSDPASVARGEFWYRRWSRSHLGYPPPEVCEELIPGALQHDQAMLYRLDFRLNPEWSDARSRVRANLTADARIYLWGCLTMETRDYDEDTWWVLFRGQTPLRSMAREMALYFDRTVMATGEGSKFEINVEGAWLTPERFEKAMGRAFGSRPSDFENFDSRLLPERSGALQEVMP